MEIEIPPGYGDKELTITHNHPNSKWGGTFSPADIKSLANNPSVGSVRAVGRKSEGTYVVKATENANYKGLSKRIAKDEPTLRKQLKAKHDSVKIIHGTNSKRTRQEAVGVVDKYYKEILPKYGFTYARDKKGR